MTYSKEYLSYNQTNSFSKIVLDYLNNDEALQPFFEKYPTKENIQLAIATKQKENTDRKILVEVLKDSYATIEITEKTKSNIEKLLLPNTFTISTAHQPNIFTGHLYFIYKILHTIKLCDTLQKENTSINFVPVYYMGSEDADLDELGHINVNNEKLEWKTNQKGAVGRMEIDDEFMTLINRIEGEFGNYECGKEIITLIKNSYKKGILLQQATLHFVHSLFGKYGLVILIADDARLKKQMIAVFKEDILHYTSSKIVAATNTQLEKHYKVQASGREINLFYFKNNIRERIEKLKNGNYVVINTNIEFTEKELITEIEEHPENFSPNVILRGLFQETILPNIAFIGGGGELAYWLQLKELFTYYKVQFPILLLRNSFLLLTEKQNNEITQLGFTKLDLFKNKIELENIFTLKNSKNTLDTNAEKEIIENVYNKLTDKASLINPTLNKHILALKTKQLNKLSAIDKKLLRAEKRNHLDGIAKINKLKNSLFPSNNLQERNDNIIPIYAKYGTTLIDEILQASLALESNFCNLIMQK
jgi:bacillithiol synthase